MFTSKVPAARTQSELTDNASQMLLSSPRQSCCHRQPVAAVLEARRRFFFFQFSGLFCIISSRCLDCERSINEDESHSGFHSKAFRSQECVTMLQILNLNFS